MTLATLVGLLVAGLLLGLFLKRRRRRLNVDGREKRQRVVQYFDCTWISRWGPMQTRLSNLSPTGCYIDSRLNVPAVGETVENITVTPSAEHPLVLHGTVIDATRGIGFAVRFTELDEDTRQRLSALLRSRQRG
ncbi:MAG: PilZ domain-containing protein [Vicinamibacterales bacterium]